MTQLGIRNSIAIKNAALLTYFGVEFSIEQLYKVMILTGHYGVFGTWWMWSEVAAILLEENQKPAY